MKAIKRYFPAVNPLAKTTLVRATFTRTGKVRRSYWRKPQFRKGIVVGYRP